MTLLKNFRILLNDFNLVAKTFIGIFLSILESKIIFPLKLKSFKILFLKIIL